MKAMKRIAAILVVMMLAAGAAQAETLSLSGTVEAGVTVPVYAPIGGTVEKVSVETGMHVAAGKKLFSYRTEKTYAPTDGTVAGVFVKAGDDAETITELYGADLYLEGKAVYSISANISKAYSSVETTLVHTGEKVYAVCRTDATRKGSGTITAIDGNSYTVMVTDGNFIPGDSVTIYRNAAHTEKLRLGRGTVSRVSPTAVNTTGAIVKVAVKDGAKVKRGDLLMETLSGTFDGYTMSGTSVTAAEEGVIMSVSAEVGATVTKGDVMAQIAPISGMRVEATVSADDRLSLKAGDKVTIELESDDTLSYQGTVRYITETPETGTETESESGEVNYKAIIDFKPDENVYFGMAVVVTTEEKATAEEDSAIEEDKAAEEDVTSEEAAAEEDVTSEADSATIDAGEKE